MQNVLAHVPQKEKKSFVAMLKSLWLAVSAQIARKRANDRMDAYEKRFPKAISCIDNGSEGSLAFYAFLGSWMLARYDLPT